MRRVVAFVGGLVFGLGLCVSQMVRPAKVLGFLHLGPGWDPSLALVMAAALAIHAAAWWYAARRSAPLLGGRWPAPAARAVDLRLLLGSAVFGVGWGLCGYCPGPAIVGAVHSRASAIFVVAMISGMIVQELARALLTTASAPRIPESCDG